MATPSHETQPPARRSGGHRLLRRTCRHCGAPIYAEPHLWDVFAQCLDCRTRAPAHSWLGLMTFAVLVVALAAALVKAMSLLAAMF